MNRRNFLLQSGMAAAGAYLTVSAGPAVRKISANDKLNIGMIGVANRAGDDLNGVSSQNIVALCDIDANYLASAAQKFPAAHTYNDFRRLIDQKDIDAIVVGTPDHTHAVATVAALKSGRHVYCEKPLTHTLSECRIVQQLARKQKLVTQLGTQIHAGKNYRRVVELIKSDAIGEVAEAHVWVNTIYGNVTIPEDRPPVPPSLSYDLWLGPVASRPYHPAYLPKTWRNWWAFGGGTMADFGCHFLDLPHWALDLGAPSSVEAHGPPLSQELVPTWMIVNYDYPSRAGKPPVRLTWYQGGRKPGSDLLSAEIGAKWVNGVLFVGKKGMLLSDYNRHQLLPEKDFAGFVAPKPFIPNSIGHHLEWIDACKYGGPTTCNFEYSGTLTEAALLGNVAYRAGKKILWDTKRLKAVDTPEADEFIHHQYRSGWSL